VQRSGFDTKLPKNLLHMKTLNAAFHEYNARDPYVFSENVDEVVDLYILWKEKVFLHQSVWYHLAALHHGLMFDKFIKSFFSKKCGEFSFFIQTVFQCCS